MSYLASTFSEIAVNRVEIPQEQLNIENKTRSNPLKWKGQFSPQLVDTLLHSYSNIDDVIFDPFLGSGTTLLEAGNRELSALGTEINPAAYSLARLYEFINIPIAERNQILADVERLLDEYIPIMLSQTPESDSAEEYIKTIMSEIMTNVVNHIEHNIIEALIVLLDFHQTNLDTNRIFKTWHKIHDLLKNLPYSEKSVRVFHADARQTPLPDRIVDLVITSPPYINVFNYHQQYRSSMEFLNWNILEVAKSEIGANRKHRGNRFLTVTQYCLDIAQCFFELQRVCKPGARGIFVVGRLSTVRGTKFYNGEIVCEIAERVLGNQLDLRQERVYQNRFGKNIFEDILHFSIKPSHKKQKDHYLSFARGVAQDIMIAALSNAPKESRKDLELALESISIMKPSPFIFED